MVNERFGPVNTPIFVNRYIDSNNHLNNAAWGLHLDTALRLSASGLGIEIKNPLQRIRIKYIKQILDGDLIDIATLLSKSGTNIEFNQSMKRGDELVGTSTGLYGNAPELDAPTDKSLAETGTSLKDVFQFKTETIHPVTALYYFENARLMLLSAKGVSAKELREEQGISFMVSTAEALFAQSMSEGDEVLIRTSFSHYRSQFKFYQQMIKSGIVINQADITCGLVDREGTLVRSSEIIDPIKQKLMSLHTPL